MNVGDKARELVSKVTNTAVGAVNDVTGRSLVLETEKFNQEMEAVYSALVIRLLASEERINRLNNQLRWTIGVAVGAIAISLIAVLLSLR